MEYLVLPGYGGSGPRHWQSLWEAEDASSPRGGANPRFRRVEQEDWNRPEADRWAEALDRAVAASPGPVILVAHSLACLLAARWAAGASSIAIAKVKGALLVAPVDPDGPAFPSEARGFSPAPRSRLPFRSIVVASSNDPYGSLEYQGGLAHAWGADFVPVGARGHINAESGLGAWPEGRSLLDSLAAG
jgi:predicted alpha/beta hydrolase family esterase